MTSQSVTPSETSKKKNDPPDTKAPAWLRSFWLRLLILAAIVAAFMSISNVNIGAVGQGLSYALVGVAVYMTFRILDFPDLSVDGSFPVGGAACAILIVSGVPAEIALLVAFAAGMLTGLVTALIHVFFKIEGLLASIIVITGAYTMTLRIMGGRSNVPLMGERTLLEPYQDPMRDWVVETFGRGMRRMSNNIVEILVFGVVVIAAIALLNWFMHTEIGLTIRASGHNSQMVRATGINPTWMIIIALMVSNGLAGIAGALTVQLLGFADVALGIGVIIRGLAAVMVGEVLLRPGSVGERLVASAVGMIIFEVSRAWVFSALDLPTSDIRLVSALVVLAALAAPNVGERWRTWRQRRERANEWNTPENS